MRVEPEDALTLPAQCDGAEHIQVSILRTVLERPLLDCECIAAQFKFIKKKKKDGQLILTFSHHLSTLLKR